MTLPTPHINWYALQIIEIISDITFNLFIMKWVLDLFSCNFCMHGNRGKNDEQTIERLSYFDW